MTGAFAEPSGIILRISPGNAHYRMTVALRIAGVLPGRLGGRLRVWLRRSRPGYELEPPYFAMTMLALVRRLKTRESEFGESFPDLSSCF